MKRWLALFITLVFTAGLVSAEQVLYLNFDNIMISNTVSSGSATFSFPMTVCIVSVSVDNLSTGATVHTSIILNSNVLYDVASTSSSIVSISTHVCGDSFTINVDQSVNSESIGWHGHVQVLVVPADSPFESFKTGVWVYLPPGAEGTPQGLLLNGTEITLNTTYTLSEGAIKFWLKWDGTKPLPILLNGSKVVVGVDSNGYLFVNSSTGQVYTLQSQVPIGKYVPIGIGWKNGFGYIMLNSSIVKVSWNGELVFNKIGNGIKTASIIDELVVYNTYIDYQYLSQLTGVTTAILQYRGEKITVYPDGGTHLPVPLTFNFYSQNGTHLGSFTWYGSSDTILVPNDTYKLIISSGGASSIYLLARVTNSIAFLSSDASGTVEPIYVVPSEPGILAVKNAQGQIIYADELKSSNDVIGVLGGSYYVSFTDENNVTRAAGWFTFTGKGLTLLLSSNLQNVTGTYANAWWDNGTLKIEFVDGTGKTNSWNLTVQYYQSAKLMSSFTLPETSRKYIATFLPPAGADEAVVKISTDSGFSKTMTVYLAKEGTGLIPSQVFPWWLLMGLFGVGGLLIAPARWKFLSPLITTGILGFAELAGMFSTPAWLLGSLTGLALLSLIIYRPSSRGD